MQDTNICLLIGRLTRNAELKYTASGQAVTKFSIAVNRSVKDGDTWKDEANFFDITIWGKQGESLVNKDFLLKGKQVGITGELRQERWEKDGQNRSKVGVVANHIQLLGGGNSGGNGDGMSRDRPPTDW
jgi:single-strand DNA-binding protein